jgi:hypothetical protein
VEDNFDPSIYGLEPLEPQKVSHGNVDFATYGLEPISSDQALFEQEKEQYKTDPTKMFAAGAAGAARALTFGASDVLGSMVGQQEELQKLQTYQPGISSLAEMGTGGLSAFFGPGALVAKAATKATQSIANPVVRAAARGAYEGSVYGIGKTVSEQALGAKESAAESLIANVGMGALLGAGFEMAGHGIGVGAQKVSTKIKDIFKGKPGAAAALAKAETRTGIGSTQMTSDLTNAEQRALNKFDFEVGPSEATVEMKFKEPIGAKRLEELEGVEIPSDLSQMQQAIRLDQLEELLPERRMQILKYHKDLFENPKAAREMKVQFENLPADKGGQFIASYNQAIVNDGRNIIFDKISALSPYRPLDTVSTEGVRILEDVKKIYDWNKDLNKHIWDDVLKIRPINKVDIDNIKLGLREKTKISKIVDFKDGQFVLKAYDSGTGLSKHEYSVFKQMFDDLEKVKTFKDLQGIREVARKELNYEDPSVTDQIALARKVLLDDMTNIAAPEIPNYRRIAQEYAQNEQALDAIERMLGGRIDSLDLINKINTDKVVDRILSNPNYQEVARSYLGDERFQEIIGSFIKRAFDDANDVRKGWQPNKFERFLSRNQNNLQRSLGDDYFVKLKAANDYAWFGRRFLDEVNPSGTAGSLAKMLPDMLNVVTSLKNQGVTGTIDSIITQSVKAVRDSEQAVQFWNEAMGLAEVTGRTSKLQTVGIYNRLGNFVKGMKKPIIPMTTIAITGSTKDYEDRLKDIREVALEPEKYTERIEKNTAGIAQIDPQLQELITSRSRIALDFIMSKVPKNPFEGSMIVSPVKWKPSDAELSKFNRYLKAIDDPLSILLDLEQGVLTNESIEALQTVYPKLFNQIKQIAIETIGRNEQQLSFHKQLQLSLLLQVPVSTIQDAQMMQRLQQGAQASGVQEEAQGQGAMRPKSKKIDGDFLKGQMSQSEQLQRSRGQ